MARDEGKRLRSRAAEARAVPTRVDHPSGEGGGARGGDLVVDQDGLGSVGHGAFLPRSRLHGQADAAGAGVGW
ncbi:hypothetical protein LUX01_01805 [Streptomyces sudanensis]|uniref:hypothetical protein n=1 Tax=Streptomyces sudanensis TaxID=436397 RepID=UPI0020CF54DC|nr:hypothetical protein [Streptomyces sudanensis]MCP9985622.1 hypothetical protein [Streptomyces sudanensis]